MTNTLRLVSTAAAGVAALALAAPALAAYDSPTLRVDNTSEQISGGGTVRLNLSVARTDDPTFRFSIYIPQGYTGNLTPAAGTQIGTVRASAQLLASPDVVLPLQGVLRTDSPAKYLTAAAQCLATATPDVDSVWLIVLDSPSGGAPIVIPGYLTAGLPGPEAAAGQAKLTVCLPPPAVGQTQAKVFEASLSLTNLLTNPAAAGSYRWRAIFVPYATNSGPVNAAGAVEVQAVDTIPALVTVRAGKYNRRSKRLTVTGTVTEVTRGVAAPVRVLLNGRRVATVRANARGQYRTTLRIPRKGRYVLRATATVAPRTVSGCQGLNPAVRCLRTVVSGFAIASATARVRIR